MSSQDIRSHQWYEEALMHIGDNLLSRLGGDAIPSNSVVGTVCKYFQTLLYELPTDCIVIAGTGDNPSSMVGMGLSQPGDIGISLGTSDTVSKFCFKFYGE